jgi:hypothetical protein
MGIIIFQLFSIGQVNSYRFIEGSNCYLFSPWKTYQETPEIVLSRSSFIEVDGIIVYSTLPYGDQNNLDEF